MERDIRFILELGQGPGVTGQARLGGGGDAWTVLFAAHGGLGAGLQILCSEQDHACLHGCFRLPGVPWECFRTSIEGSWEPCASLVIIRPILSVVFSDHISRI